MYDKGANWDWNGIDIDNRNNSAMTIDKIKSAGEFDHAPVTTHPAEIAFEKVISYAGASLHRDSQDKRIMEEARNRTYTYKGSLLGGLGIIDNPNDVGGWPQLNSLPAPKDTDQDGIPDNWETANGLNPNDSSDGASLFKDGSGYTNLEVYINSIVEPIMKTENENAEINLNEIYPSYSLPTAVTNLGTPSLHIYRNNDKSIIEGLEGNALIEVYTPNGLLSQSFHTSNNKAVVKTPQLSIIKIIQSQRVSIIKTL